MSEPEDCGCQKQGELILINPTTFRAILPDGSTMFIERGAYEMTKDFLSTPEAPTVATTEFAYYSEVDRDGRVVKSETISPGVTQYRYVCEWKPGPTPTMQDFVKRRMEETKRAMRNLSDYYRTRAGRRTFTELEARAATSRYWAQRLRWLRRRRRA